jgi:Cholesterol-capturing domain
VPINLFDIHQVFEYHWHDVITYDVMLVLLSFILAWGEAWFFDFRMIPLEAKVTGILLFIAVPLPGTGTIPILKNFRYCNHNHCFGAGQSRIFFLV